MTMTTTTKRLNRKQRAAVADNLVAVAAAQNAPSLVGEVITWTAGPNEHPHSSVLAALQAAGLAKDADEARAIARPRQPRHAFSRACRELGQERIIRLLPDKCTKDSLVFQFTKEQLIGGEFTYPKETELTLATETGDVTCDIPDLAHKAKQLVEEHLESWTTGDITTIVQRLFDRETGVGLTPLREQGGAYLVLQSHVAFAQKVQQFLGRLGGGMRRLPVVAGTPQGDRAVKESLKDHMESVIRQFEREVADFGVSTLPATLARKAERIKELRHTIESYRVYLADEMAGVAGKLAGAEVTLKQRIEQIAEAKEAEAWAECDHCRCLQAVPEGTPLHKCKQCGRDFEIQW